MANRTKRPVGHFCLRLDRHGGQCQEGFLDIVHGHGARVIDRGDIARPGPEVTDDFRLRLRELVAAARARGLTTRKVEDWRKRWRIYDRFVICDPARCLGCVAFIAATVWHFAPGRNQSRGATFFGVRVEPGFAESRTGLAISRQFRCRVWLSASAAALISCLLPLDLAVFLGSLLSSFAGLEGFARASRRARRETLTTGESTVRVASSLTKRIGWRCWSHRRFRARHL